MIKIILYLLLTATLCVVGFALYVWWSFIRIPSLEVSPDMPPQTMANNVTVWAQRLQEEGKFNGTILIIRRGEPVLAKGFGFTDHTRDRKLTADSSMRVASLSKQFTAAAIMALVDDGKLSLDESLIDHVPQLQYPEVTIRHLLNQSSGIPDLYIELATERESEISVLTNKKVIDLMSTADLPLDFLPGSQYQYSNTNYVILAHIAEQVAGTSLETYLDERLLTPLGMTNTRIWNLVSERETSSNHTTGFSIYDEVPSSSEAKPGFLDGVSGDGAVHTSAHDIIKWNKFWIDGASLVSPDLILEAQTATKLTTGLSSTYGYGWVIEKDHIWHNGRWLAARSMFLRSRDGKSALLVIDNGSSVMFDSIVNELRPTMPFGNLGN